MTKFSIKNIFVYWLKMWPITVIFIILGAVFGVLAAIDMEQSYVSTASVLVRNQDPTAVPGDYLGIMNSRVMLDDAISSSGTNSDCSLLTVGSGNVLTITATCLSSKEDSKALEESAIKIFEKKVGDLYGEENVEVVNLSGEVETAKAVSEQDYVARIVAAVLAGFLISGVIAFVRFDYNNTKKLRK